MRIVAPALAMLCVAGAASAGDLTATAYQVTPAHNAVVKFSKHWGTSLKTRWTATLDGSASFPLVVGRSVYALVAGEPEEIVRIDVGIQVVREVRPAVATGAADGAVLEERLARSDRRR